MYILDGSEIRAPHEFKEENSTQFAAHRTLSGTIRRDYFGTNKKVWTLEYRNTQKVEYDLIKTSYDTYLSTGTLRTLEITETNYTIALTSVHIDLQERGFSVRGNDYLSDFTLTLTEA